MAVTKDIETPLFRAYLMSLQRFPSYAPNLPLWTSFAAFGLVVLASTELVSTFVAVWLGIGAAVALPYGSKLIWKPTNPQERAEKEFLDSVWDMRMRATERSLKKKLPAEILAAIEQLMAARATALARLSESTESATEEIRERIETQTRSARLAVKPIFRTDLMTRKEWDALCENGPFLNSIVDCFTNIEISIREMGSVLSAERLAALRELGDRSESKLYLNDH